MTRTKGKTMQTEVVQAQIVQEESQEFSQDDRTRVAAYLNWEQQTGGNPVDDETTRQFWLDAEKQLQSYDPE